MSSNLSSMSSITNTYVDKLLVRRRRRRRRRGRRGSSSSARNDTVASSDIDSYDGFVSKITKPRVDFGTSIHRKLHRIALKHTAYEYQWRAFCARAKYDAKNVIDDDAETFLSGFHFKLEDGITRFDSDVKTGKAEKAWDVGSAMHPTIGLMAISAAWKSACEECLGRSWLF